MATPNRIISIDQFLEVHADDKPRQLVLIKFYPCHLAITPKDINYVEEADGQSSEHFGRFLLKDISMEIVNEPLKLIAVKTTDAPGINWKVYRLVVSNKQSTTLERRWRKWQNIITCMNSGQNQGVEPCERMTLIFNEKRFPHRPQSASLFKVGSGLYRKQKKGKRSTSDTKSLLGSHENEDCNFNVKSTDSSRKRKWMVDVKEKKQKLQNKFSTKSVELAKKILLSCIGIKLEE